MSVPHLFIDLRETFYRHKGKILIVSSSFYVGWKYVLPVIKNVYGVYNLLKSFRDDSSSHSLEYRRDGVLEKVLKLSGTFFETTNAPYSILSESIERCLLDLHQLSDIEDVLPSVTDSNDEMNDNMQIDTGKERLRNIFLCTQTHLILSAIVVTLKVSGLRTLLHCLVLSCHEEAEFNLMNLRISETTFEAYSEFIDDMIPIFEELTKKRLDDKGINSEHRFDLDEILTGIIETAYETTMEVLDGSFFQNLVSRSGSIHQNDIKSQNLEGSKILNLFCDVIESSHFRLCVSLTTMDILNSVIGEERPLLEELNHEAWLLSALIEWRQITINSGHNLFLLSKHHISLEESLKNGIRTL